MTSEDVVIELSKEIPNKETSEDRPPEGLVSEDRPPEGLVSEDRPPEGLVSEDTPPEGLVSEDTPPEGLVDTFQKENESEMLGEGNLNGVDVPDRTVSPHALHNEQGATCVSVSESVNSCGYTISDKVKEKDVSVPLQVTVESDHLFDLD